MPVNDFEKLVQQKMEELNFNPSAEVWTSVERRIGEKKKRRFFFWLPIIFLAAGGITWWMIGNNSHGNKTSSTIDRPTVQNIKKNSTQEPTVNMELKDKPVVSGNKPVTNWIPRKEPTDISILLSENLKNKKTQVKEIHIRPDPKVVEPVFKPGEQKSQLNDRAISESEMPVKNIAPKNNETPKPELLKEPGKKQAAGDSVAEKIPIGPVTTIAKNGSKKNTSKWIKEIIAEIGLSNVSSGLFSNSLNYSPSAVSSPGPGFYAPHKPTRAVSFALGFELSRNLEHLLNFGIGLQYHYYSIRTVTGAPVRKDSTINYGGGTVAITQYYKNGIGFEYKSHFQMIEIPLSLEYRPLRNLPLHIEAGASYGLLLNTNALTFDRNSNIYYRNKKDYARNSFAIFSSVKYAWLRMKKITVQSGPGFGFNCTTLQNDKSYGTPHLISFGLKTNIFFK